ncbi:hypothetical protein JCM5296_004055 [Sporobolomyces johnsonii]
MQAAPRALRTTVLRQATRSQAPQPFASYATPSLHSPSPAATWSAPPPTHRFPTSHVRTFSSSPVPAAREADSSPFDGSAFQQHAPLFDRIQQFPEVLEAIEHMANITREKTGVDLRGGEKPTMSMMFSLARDPDLRAAAERLMAALRGAGIEIDPSQAFRALQMMGGDGFDGTKGVPGLHEMVNKGDGNDGEGEGEGEGKGGKR